MRFTYLLLWIFGPRSFVEMIADKMIASTALHSDQLVNVVASARRAATSGLLAAAQAAMLDRADLVPTLAGLDLPVLFLAGSDPTAPAERPGWDQTLC